jgi:hypothetical protein
VEAGGEIQLPDMSLFAVCCVILEQILIPHCSKYMAWVQDCPVRAQLCPRLLQHYAGNFFILLVLPFSGEAEFTRDGNNYSFHIYVSRTALFCAITQGVVIIPYRRFGTNYRVPSSGFRREVDEKCALLGYYAGSSGNSLPTFRDKLSGPIFRLPPGSRREMRSFGLLRRE